MELNRNQYFFAGIVVVLLGVQLRMVSSYELTPEASRLLAQRPAATVNAFGAVQQPIAQVARRVVTPPEWLGWCLMSVGSVLILHSLAMRKPGT